MRRLIGSMLAGCAAALVLAGCSGDADVIDRNAVAEEISKRLTTKVGRTPDSVTCPDELARVVGESMRCQLDDKGRVYGVTVTVTAVKDGKTVNDTQLDIEVDQQPQ